MTSFDRFERSLPELFDELAAPRRPDYFDDILTRTAATRQRPGWSFPERWLPMSALTGRLATVPRIPLRLAALVALLLVTALIGAILAGSRPRNLPAPFGPAANGVIPFTIGGDLYVGDPVTGTRRLLVGGPEGDASPQFSPDGTKIAFVRTSSGVAIDIYVVQSDGSNPRRITSEHFAGWQWITWTPDSRRVAVVHNVRGVNQLDLLDASGSGSAERIEAAVGLDSLQFRPPDGREILFRAGVDDATGTSNSTSYGLFVMNADGTNVRTVAEPATTGDTLDLTGAAYSADGSRIFYNRWTSDASLGSEGCCQLFVMNADGSDQHQFIPNAGEAWDGQAAVSPDGTRIAFWHNDKPTHGVSVIRADGTGPVIETGPALASTAHWVWSPDSSKILMYPNENPTLSVYLLDPDGGPWTTVAWQSDGDLDWQRVASAP
jgi:Tol biopolymer transport system component